MSTLFAFYVLLAAYIKIMEQLKLVVEKAWENNELLTNPETVEAINTVLEELDKGRLRVAEPVGDNWQVNDWIKKAVILYFPLRKMETTEVGILSFMIRFL